MSEYIDDYETCYKAFAELRVYSGENHPEEVTAFLGVTPSEVKLKGEGKKTYVNGWFLSSEENINSKDIRRHLDWLLSLITPKKKLILLLIKKGFKINISCYWTSMHGMGGPKISPKQMKQISDLNIDLEFEFFSFS